VKKPLVGAVVAMVVFAAIIAGCGSSSTTSTGETSTSSSSETSQLTPKSGGVMRIVTTPIGGVIGWPADPSASIGKFVIQSCFETLLHGDSEGNLGPWLATSYELADDLSSMTLTLRQDVKFHDGSDFNAAVAKWNLDNYIQAGIEPNWASVDVIDDYTIKVNFTPGGWVNTLPTTLGDNFNAAYMVSKVAYDQYGLDWMKSNPVGTGPFKFESFSLDSGMTVVKNTEYWVEGRPYLDGIEFVFVADSFAAKALIQSGEADMVTTQTGQLSADYKDLGLTVDTSLEMTEVLIPDTANPESPWSKKEVREAAEYAIDRESIAEAYGYGYWKVPYQIPPRETTAYNADFTLGREYNVAKAKELLAAAGYPDGFDTTIIVFPEAAIKDISVAIQSDLAEVGIRVKLEYPDVGKFMTYMYGGTWPTNSVLFQGLPMIDPTYVGGIQFMFASIGQSWDRPAAITTDLAAALGSETPDITLVRKVTDAITEDALLIPISELGTGVAKQTYVMAPYGDRGTLIDWSLQEFWLNK
jgi:peptide/nickel transport system substrate-binding protein